MAKTLPRTSSTVDEVMRQMRALQGHDGDYRGSRTWGLIYNAGPEVDAMLHAAVDHTLKENALNPLVFPSLREMQRDIVAIAADLFNGGEDCGGAVTSGGTESISNAPWRIAKPKSLHQIPRFLGLEPGSQPDEDEPPLELEAAEAMSQALGLSRGEQDAWALKSHLRAAAAREARRFVGEIVPLRGNAEEARDQSAIEPDLEDLEKLPPVLAPDGSLTAGNTSTLHDGAGFAVIVSERQWQRLGQPPALRLLASATQGVGPDRDALAPVEAARKLMTRLPDLDMASIGVVELSERSAAQAIAVGRELGIDADRINPDGGAIARGHPLGAAGAVLVVLSLAMLGSLRRRQASLLFRLQEARGDDAVDNSLCI